MISSREIEVTLIGMHSLIIPDEYAKPFLEKGLERVKVLATYLDKKVDFHAALQRDKDGNIRIVFGKQLQKKLGVFKNDYFLLKLSEDQTKYGVEMPEELDVVLASDPEAYEIFESLTDGRKRSIIYFVKRYKSTQGRVDKSLMITANLKNGFHDSKQLFKQN